MSLDAFADVIDGIRPLSRLEHPREVIRQFTPNWFAATMGTGILALACRRSPRSDRLCSASAQRCG